MESDRRLKVRKPFLHPGSSTSLLDFLLMQSYRSTVHSATPERYDEWQYRGYRATATPVISESPAATEAPTGIGEMHCAASQD